MTQPARHLLLRRGTLAALIGLALLPCAAVAGDQTQSAQTEPAQTQPAQTQPAQTQPAQTQPAQTQPSQTQPAQADASRQSFFGIGADSQTARDLTRWIPQMADIGIREIRTCNPDQMDYLDGFHIHFDGLLLGVPPGDRLDKPGTLPVKDLPAWSAFVSDRVHKANGRVKNWEVWNEPPNFIGKNQTPADYAKIVVSTYDTARAIDPTCRIGLCVKSVDLSWMERSIEAGAKDHFDYVVLHPYETLGVAADHGGAEPVFLNIVSNVRKMLAASDPAKRDVPIIFTELGADAGSKGPTHNGLEHQAHSLVKAYAMGIAQGVDCIDWFEGTDGDSGPMGLLDRKLKPRPSYTAMAQMIQHLGQRPTYLGWVLFNDKDWGFVFNGAKGPVLITWAPSGATDSVDFGMPVQIVDPLTGKTATDKTCALTDAPVIILDVPESVLTQAKANNGKPYPWAGYYTDATSVSVTYGETNVEKGLHTQSADSVAHDVLAYGGSARSGGVPGGNVFMVDPNFLSYTHTPIEISIVVRRNEANDNAGFKLVYESTKGFKNFGWFTVPDNKQWHTVKWKITDAEFVGMWGFNFSLDSDGNKYNKYDIQSVTVTKLPE